MKTKIKNKLVNIGYYIVTIISLIIGLIGIGTTILLAIALIKYIFG